jgi:DNA-binding NarL/FixJ family response regulator
LESMGRLLAASLERILTMGGKFTGEVPLIPRPSLDSEARLINDGPAPSLSMLLIVEDNDSVRQTLADLFPLYAPNKFRIEQAINIAEGKLKLDAKPDVVLLDLMLPDGDGVEILKAVRERAMPTKVYVMTARHPDTLDYVKQYNPDGLYIKPTPASIVVRAVLEGLKR